MTENARLEVRVYDKNRKVKAYGQASRSNEIKEARQHYECADGRDADYSIN